jgi:hypothetical protein
VVAWVLTYGIYYGGGICCYTSYFCACISLDSSSCMCCSCYYYIVGLLDGVISTTFVLF